MKQSINKSINFKSQIPFLDILHKIDSDTDANIYIVGGLIRDLMLNRKNNDLDIVPLSADYTLIAKEFKKYLKCTMIAFKDNIRLIKKNFVIDVSAPRGKTIEEDLNFRDFTINNLALDTEGNLIGNTDDFEKKLIRAVYDKTFDDDPLRILRAFRFVSQIGFDIEENTLKLIKVKKELLSSVATERIFEEIKKMTTGDFLPDAIDLLNETEVLGVIIPELNELKNTGYNKYHKKDAFSHTLIAVKIAHRFTKKLRLNDTDSIILISAILFHDLGKGDKFYKNGTSYIGHEKISHNLAENIMTRLHYPKKMMKIILNLILYHSKIRIYSVEGARTTTLQKFIYKNNENFNLHILVALIDALAKDNLNYIDKFYETIRRLRKLKYEMDFGLKNIINGNDLIKLGIKPTPEMKNILDDVHFRLVTKSLETKEQAEKYIKNNYLRG